MMKIVQAGRMKMPALGLGTWQIDGESCRAAVRDALTQGYRHIDTAQAYENEGQVGRGIADAGVARDEIFLTTKVWRDRMTSRLLMASVDDSLRRLGTDYIDLLLVHWPNDEVPLEDTLQGLQWVQGNGKVHHIGVSNFPARLLERALALAPLHCLQVELHPYLQQRELVELCAAHGVALTAYSPLARGRVNQDPVLRRIAETHDRTPAQVTLRWLMQLGPHVAAIPKAASSEHRRANLHVFDFELSDEEMAAIAGLERGERLIDPAWAPQW